jgi:superfamily II DNA helicase RecQ
MPTGAGKTLPYQMMAKLNQNKGQEGGVTVVILPLVAMVIDSFKKSEDLGISCLKIHSIGDSSKYEN